MYPDTSDANVNYAAPSSVDGEVSQVANAKAASDTRVTDIEIDWAVLWWLVSKYKTHYTNTLDAR